MKKVISIIFMLLVCFSAYSQDESLTGSQTAQETDMVKIYFDHDKSFVNLNIPQNRESLSHFSDLFEKLSKDSLSSILSIEVNSYTSPEGSRLHNKKLSERRANSICDYLVNTLSVPDSLIHKKYSGADWLGLKKLVEETDMQYKEEVLTILNDVPEETWQRVRPNDKWLTLVDSRNKHLMELNYGNSYRWMFANIYPQLRNGSVVTIYYKRELCTKLELEKEFVTIERGDSIPVLELEPTFTMSKPLVYDEKSTKFAIKTNLLYDLLLIPTIELELPIGKRWSISGEWIFPWWVTKDNGNALQILSGQLEGRYWFGNRTSKPQLTGWFTGFYAGGGLYDLQWNNNGYQGEFYIAAGVSAGYAHTINKSGSLRMEYSVGLGYLQTDYRYYEGMQDNNYLVWQHDGSYTWLGPTKAKISLVWFINSNRRGGGR